MAHLDVVPVEGTWRHPPFSAEIADGTIWGRGTLDDKGCVVAICEAVETLLEQGVRPGPGRLALLRLRRGGLRLGGPRAVAELSRRGVRPWFVLDEGGAIADEAFPGVARRSA